MAPSVRKMLEAKHPTKIPNWWQFCLSVTEVKATWKKANRLCGSNSCKCLYREESSDSTSSFLGFFFSPFESRSVWNVSTREFRWRFGNAGPSDVSQWRTAPPFPPSPSPSQVAGLCRPLKQPFEALQTRHLLLPLPHSTLSSARGRHLGWQERLRAKKHLERAGWMSGGLAVMSPLNVRRGARNIKCRPYRPALASHNPNRGQRVKAIHNSSARPPRSPQVVQHGGPFKGCGYMSCETKMDFSFFFYDYFFFTRLKKKRLFEPKSGGVFIAAKGCVHEMAQPFAAPFFILCKTWVKGGAILFFCCSFFLVSRGLFPKHR